MATDSALDILRRAAEARGQLLRCEADHSGSDPGQLILTFDVGRVLIEPLVGGLSAKSLENPGEGPGGLKRLEEAEPWWRLFGNPLTAVSETDQGTGVALRFREDADNPRVVRLISTGSSIAVSMDSPGH